MSPILFFIIFFTCTSVGKIFLQINSAAVAFFDILIAAWEGLNVRVNLFFTTSYEGVYLKAEFSNKNTEYGCPEGRSNLTL